jgi:hypothetical protein
MTKLMTVCLLSGLALSGCAKVPGLLTKPAEVERIAIPHVKAPHTPTPVAEGMTGIPGLYVDHQLVSEYGAGMNVNHQTPSLSAGGTDKSSASESSGQAGGLAGVSATLDIVSKPKESLRVFPVFASEAEVSDVLLPPAAAKPTWKLKSTGMPIVAKVKFSLTDAQGQHAQEFHSDARDVGWPRVFGITQDVSIALDHDQLKQYFHENPKSTGSVKVTATPEDFSGKAIQTTEGKPLELALSLSVF